MSVAGDAFQAAMLDAIRRDDQDTVVALAVEASETVRRAARPAIAKAVAELGWAPGNAAALALLATATARQLRSAFWLPRRLGERPERAVRVIAARGREFASIVCTDILGDAGGGPSWPLVRALVRDGAVDRPPGAAYLQCMVSWLGEGEWTDPAHRYHGLLADPTLLEREVWELFEVDVTNDLTNARLYGAGADGRGLQSMQRNTWIVALVRLAGEGCISRERLLDASLAALTRDFRPTTVGWHVTMHEALEPSDAERRARLDRYLGLLDSPVPAIVKCGLGAVRQLESEIEPVVLARSLVGPLTQRQKNLAVEALGLLDRSCKRSPEARATLLETVSAGLAHERADVQEKALSVIERHRVDDAVVREAIAAARTTCSPTLHARLDALIGEAQPHATVGDDDAVAPNADELAERVAALPSLLAPPARAAVEAVAVGSWPEPRHLPMTPELLRALVPRLERIEDEDEALALAAALLEGEGTGDDVERLLDAALRIPAARLHGRASGVLERAQELRTATLRLDARRLVAHLVCGWLDGDRPRDLIAGETALGIHARRIEEAFRDRSRRPLLSTPTHCGGWVDPATLPAPAGGRLRRLVGRPSLDEQVARIRSTFSPASVGVSRFAIEERGEAWRRQKVLVVRPAIELPEPVAPLVRELAVAREWWWVVFYEGEVMPTWLATDALGARWLATLVPATPEIPFAAAASALWAALDADNLEARPETALERALDSLVPLDAGGWQAIAHGLLARSPAASRCAADVVVATIEDGRFDPARLGAALAWMIGQGHGVVARAAAHLRDVARISSLHGAQVFRCGEAFIASVGAIDKGANALLETMLELSVSLAAPVSSDGARTELEAIVARTGRGAKLSTLSRGLLAAEPRPGSGFDRARVSAAAAVLSGVESLGVPQ